MSDKQVFLFSSKQEENEVYWPGLFIVLDSKHQTGKAEDYAYFRVRAAKNGGDFKGPQITQTVGGPWACPSRPMNGTLLRTPRCR